MACSRCGNDCSCACSGDPLPAQDWRRQVSLKVRAHKAKRRRLDPDSPFLEFEEQDLVAIQQPLAPVHEESGWQWHDEESQPMSPGVSNILSSSHASFEEDDLRPAPQPEKIATDSVHVEEVARPPLAPFPRITTPAPKIIEFPRVQRQYELADPVADQLRIFEAVDEAVPHAPTHLSSIEIAPEEPIQTVIEIETPIQAAALQNRVYAAALDLVVLMGGAGIFAGCAQVFISSLPPTRHLLASAAVCGLLLLTIYYWLSFSLHRSTIGIDAAGLTVVRFSGEPPSRLLLRWRAVATVLSYAALGMGLAWSLIDEDRLCWHDRITHTYLVVK